MNIAEILNIQKSKIINNSTPYYTNNLRNSKNLNVFLKLVLQLGSLTLITLAGPIIIFLLFLKQGNL